MANYTDRVRDGVFTLGGATPLEFSCEATNIRITPTTNTEDPLETLCGTMLTGVGTTTWAINGSSYQKLSDPKAFVRFCFDNDGSTVDYTWQPNPEADIFSGQCTIQAVEIGGDVGARLTSDFTFACTAKPLLTPAP